jgi:hypothetical protein
MRITSRSRMSVIYAPPTQALKWTSSRMRHEYGASVAAHCGCAPCAHVCKVRVGHLRMDPGALVAYGEKKGLVSTSAAVTPGFLGHLHAFS